MVTDLSLAQVLQFLAAPFVASLILTGIHSYLGLHVVERGVIFVDLSLAQIAALGGTIALLLPMSGGDPHAHRPVPAGPAQAAVLPGTGAPRPQQPDRV